MSSDSDGYGISRRFRCLCLHAFVRSCALVFVLVSHRSKGPKGESYAVSVSIFSILF